MRQQSLPLMIHCVAVLPEDTADIPLKPLIRGGRIKCSQWVVIQRQKMLTSSVESEVQRERGDYREGVKSADKLGVFSSNACQHLKVLEELSLSPGTRRQPQVLVLNADQLGGEM